MIVRAGTGWQYLLADLSLILFLVTAAALSQTPGGSGAVPVSPQGEPLALYRVEAGAPPLGRWLQDQSADARQQLTIVARYAPGRQAEALSQAETLAGEAGAAGNSARIVIEPGSGGITASLAYDVPAASMARDLHNKEQANSVQKDRP